jgi:Tol biopolymer transport system component
VQSGYGDGGVTQSVVSVPPGGGSLRTFASSSNFDLGEPYWRADGRVLGVYLAGRFRLFAASGAPRGSQARPFDAYSPDRRWMQWHQETGAPGMYWARRDGSREKHIGLAEPAGWARDGRLFYKGKDSKLYAIEVDRTHNVAISHSGVGAFDLSPDRKWFAYDNGKGVWAANAAGTRKRRLFRKGTQPQWSPDGERVAFFVRGSQQDNIWTVNRNGSGARRVVGGFEAGTIVEFSWSPNGRRLLFEAENLQDPANFEYVARDLYVVPSRAGKAKLITPGPPAHDDSEGVWSPDSRWVAYESDRQSQAPEFCGADCNSQDIPDEIWITARDGSGTRRLVEGGANGAIAWQSLPR